ncbi:GntR family transcriptional regulator [Aquipuribacter sp. MA13-6]|uniref:GntR family transcriptional regulator n=1 Tax=unclassified Aquipuribacter TaxID=2635084 RepID=UPI003EEFDF38
MALRAVDDAAPEPGFLQIAGQLRQEIRSGAYPPGSKLPSETELTRTFGVARMTVRGGIAELRSEGLVVSEQGRGVFVRARPPVRRLAADRFARRHRDAGRDAFLAEADQVGSTPAVDEVVVDTASAPERVASLLEVGGDVVRRSRRYLLDGRPVETAVSYIPLDLAQGTKIADPDTGPGGIYARLEELGHQLDHFTEEVGARMPTPGERERLQLTAGVPVITLLRTAYDTTGRAVEVCDTVKSAQSYVLEYRVDAT